MPQLDSVTRARLPDSAFAYIDSNGVRRLPINDASHVRNALARFGQVDFESDGAREHARQRLLRAAKRHGIMPLGFFDGQLRREQQTGRSAASARLPRGQLTFLLADIEGSTRLVQRLGKRYAVLLRDVRALIRGSIRVSDGHEVDARADEYFAVFRRAASALDAALAVQRGLQERTWPGDEEVCVRIGLHSGRPTLTDAGYVGIAVHTAARICSAGHGGQILLSATAHAALGGTLRDGLSVRDLGRYSLPSLPEPLTLYQVRAAGLRDRFPDLRTITTRAGGIAAS